MLTFNFPWITSSIWMSVGCLSSSYMQVDTVKIVISDSVPLPNSFFFIKVVPNIIWLLVLSLFPWYDNSACINSDSWFYNRVDMWRVLFMHFWEILFKLNVRGICENTVCLASRMSGDDSQILVTKNAYYALRPRFTYINKHSMTIIPY